MTSSNDFFEQPKEPQSAGTVEEIRDRFIAAGARCKMERQDDEVRLVFDGRKCYLRFTVNASGRPLTASMPDATDYDADFGQIVFKVFESIGWKFQL